MCPTVERATTAQGCGALMIVFSGATILMAASEPALFGSLGPTTHLTPNDV